MPFKQGIVIEIEFNLSLDVTSQQETSIEIIQSLMTPCTESAPLHVHTQGKTTLEDTHMS